MSWTIHEKERVEVSLRTGKENLLQVDVLGCPHRTKLTTPPGIKTITTNVKDDTSLDIVSILYECVRPLLTATRDDRPRSGPSEKPPS